MKTYKRKNNVINYNLEYYNKRRNDFIAKKICKKCGGSYNIKNKYTHYRTYKHNYKNNIEIYYINVNIIYNYRSIKVNVINNYNNIENEINNKIILVDDKKENIISVDNIFEIINH
jgi:hypothetical protein